MLPRVCHQVTGASFPRSPETLSPLPVVPVQPPRQAFSNCAWRPASNPMSHVLGFGLAASHLPALDSVPVPGCQGTDHSNVEWCNVTTAKAGHGVYGAEVLSCELLTWVWAGASGVAASPSSFGLEGDAGSCLLIGGVCRDGGPGALGLLTAGWLSSRRVS